MQLGEFASNHKVLLSKLVTVKQNAN